MGFLNLMQSFLPIVVLPQVNYIHLHRQKLEFRERTLLQKDVEETIEELRETDKVHFSQQTRPR